MAGGSWTFLGENVVSRDRREVREGGKRWIDFEVVFWRGEEKTGTLRVRSRNPAARLPEKEVANFYIPLSCGRPGGHLCVGRSGERRDCRSGSSEECQKVIRAMAASRAKIGNFRLVVLGRAQPFGWIVWRKGERWRIDFLCGPYGPQAMRGAKPPDGLGWNDPFIQKLESPGWGQIASATAARSTRTRQAY